MPYPLPDDTMRQKYATELEQMEQSDDDTDDELFHPRDLDDACNAVELARYLVWLGRTGVEHISGKQLAILALGFVGRGRWMGAVTVDLGLPTPPRWE